MSTTRHTCATSGRSSCPPCMQFEVELWDAINRYAITVGGDPAHHVYGNTARMQAVADVGKIVARVASREQIDDIVVEDLAKASGAAAAAACDRGFEIKRLQAALREVRGFLRGVARRSELGHGAKDLIDEADAIDRVLDGKEMWSR